jgi:FlaA1/EpsC-like NDP-sugar epimerase
MNPAIKKLKNLNRKNKLFLVMLNDFLLALVCWLVFGPPIATYIASEFSSGILEILKSEWKSFLFPASLSIGFLYIFGFYKSLIKFFDSKDSILLSLIGSLVFGFSWSIIHVYQFKIVSTSFLSIAVLQGILLSAVFYAFLNISRDVAKYLLYPKNINSDAKKIVIYGAGNSGNELFQSIMLDPSMQILAFFDNGKNLKGLQINNIPILSSFKELKILKEKHPDLEVLLAIPSIDSKKRREIIAELEEIKVAVRTVPSFHEIISDQKQLTNLQNLSIDDLLPRAIVSKNILKSANEKIFFISGAGGSIGSEIVRQLLDSNPKLLILFDFSEFNLFNIDRECQAIKSAQNLNSQILPILGDIRDKKNLDFLFKKFDIDYVYHAAAYKHVPLVENTNNITKACENNIIGTFNLASTSIDHKVKCFVMISTDKAVRPSNVMGASKRMAEMLIQSLNTHASETKLSMVRFGNVINSSGSAIPLFLDQIAKGGPVTITHKKVTRYFMTIPEASNLVLQAAEMSDGGEVFILHMGEQIKIVDLARKLIHLSGRNVAIEPGSKGIEIVEIGLRPGEKMYEELLISADQIPTKNSKIFKAMEKFPSQDLMKPIIADIKAAISANDFTALKSILANHVEGYQPENS